MVKLEQNGITWIDIANPTKEKIEALSKLVKLHPLVKQELSIPMFRAKVEAYDDLIYLVIHLPIYDEAVKISEPREIDFVITPNILVSGHYQAIPTLTMFFQKLKEDEKLRKRILRLNTVKLLHELLLTLFTFTQRELDHVEEKISLIEKDIFADRQKDMVRLLSLLRSDIINFSRAMKPLEPVFSELKQKAATLFGKHWNLYFTNIASEYRKTMNIVATRRQTIASLQTTNDSLLSFHINQLLKIIAVINLLVIPITLLESVIGIRWYFQEIQGPFAILGVSVTILLGAFMDVALLVFFRYKKWL